MYLFVILGVSSGAAGLASFFWLVECQWRVLLVSALVGFPCLLFHKSDLTGRGLLA